MLQRTATRMRDKIELEAEQQGWRPELHFVWNNL